MPERAVREAVAVLGGSTSVNNVGIARHARFEEVPDEEWDAYWQLNVMSYVRAIRAALPHLSRERDRQRLLDVRKAALDRHAALLGDEGCGALALALRRRPVRKDGIRCNAVTPGPTATEAWLGEGGLADQQGGNRGDVLEKVGAGRPLGRLATPEEIAAVIVFLCSERASYVTGAAWSADGARSRSSVMSPFEERIRALEETLSPFAARSFATRGRELAEEECEVRTPFQRDRDRIVHSKPFRRLKGRRRCSSTRRATTTARA